MTNYGSYGELRAKALNGNQEDINALGEWFEQYDDRYWNGEYYNADDGMRLFPVYEEVAEDEWKLKRYEFR